MEGQNFLLKDYKALGTVWYIELFGAPNNTEISVLKERVIQEIENFQEKYSRFNQSSLLNTLNKAKEVYFEPDLYSMLVQSEDWRIKTGGIFDIAIKDKLESIGYGTRALEDKITIPPEESPSASRVYKQGDSILWNSELQIDLGGIGKGYLIEKLAGVLKDCGQKYFLINGGGDMVATSQSDNPVEVLLEHPTELGTYIGKIFLRDESLCASSSFKRTWTDDGILRNHFIDTQKDSLIESASFVISKTATDADVLATVVAILSDSESRVIESASFNEAEYLTVNKSGEVFASERFKQALKAL